MLSAIKRILFVCIALCCVSLRPVEVNFFSVSILQDGKEIPVKSNCVQLNKRPFVIEFTFPSPIGVFVSASFDEESYKLAKKKKNYSQIPVFIASGMAEVPVNVNKELLICDKAPSYWFYENELMSLFDNVTTTNGTTICKRTVEKFNLVDKSTTLKLADVKKTLYLVFLVKERGKSNDADIELQRECLVVKWK